MQSWNPLAYKLATTTYTCICTLHVNNYTLTEIHIMDTAFLISLGKIP